MGLIISSFIVIAAIIIFFSFLIRSFLKKMGKEKASKFLRTIEVYGYVILFISIGWSFLVELLQSGLNDANMYKLHSRLDYIWQMNGELLTTIEKGDFSLIKDWYSNRSIEWYHLNNYTEVIKSQESSVRILQIIFISVSTVFIALGRAKELIFKD